MTIGGTVWPEPRNVAAAPSNSPKNGIEVPKIAMYHAPCRTTSGSETKREKSGRRRRRVTK